MPKPLIRIKDGVVLQLEDEQDGGRIVKVCVGDSRGWWELREVWNAERTMNGLIIVNTRGDWYWVRAFGDS